jgi:hypothetical protein
MWLLLLSAGAAAAAAGLAAAVAANAAPAAISGNSHQGLVHGSDGGSASSLLLCIIYAVADGQWGALARA